MHETKTKPTPLILKILGYVFFCVYTVFAVVLSVLLIKLPILPLKYFLPIILVLIILEIVFLIFIIKKSTKNYTRIFCIIFELIFSAAIGFAIFYFGSTINFFDAIKPHEYQIEEYYIIVQKESSFDTIDDLENRTIATYDDYSENYHDALQELEKKTPIDIKSYENLSSAISTLTTSEVDSCFIKSALAKIASELFTNFDLDNYRIIDTIQIKFRVDSPIGKDFDITKDSVNILISGIDTYGNISTVSNSDVNIVVTINPRTHTILLTTIPRDYEVQLHGTTGIKDKLTHAGIYGINMSIQTIEDLLDIEIDYYIRINFDSTIKLIDAIGGVDVTPDATFYRPKYNCQFKEGVTIHLDGYCALTYARERKVYGLGDLHRIQNQQDIITAVVNKLTSSKTLLTNYTNILASLSDSIETNIPSEQFYRLINLQLDSMPSWNLERNTVNGTEIHVPTYTIPDQILFVFQQDPESIAAASAKIHEVKNAN